MRMLSDWIDSLLWPQFTLRGGGAALTLQPGQVCSVQGAAGWRVVVESGNLWLTEPGDATDYCLTRGQRHDVRTRGRLVLECLGSAAARFELQRVPRREQRREPVKAPRPETGRPRTPPDAPRLAARWRGPSSA